MPPYAQAVCTATILFAAAVYLRGWLHLHKASAAPIPVWRAASFLLGLLAIWVAIASPVAVSDQRMLTAHMIQHLLLMTIASPMIWLASPVMAVWHVPAIFKLGMQSETWHAIEQASFLATGLLFWWPVIQPVVSESADPRWT